MTSSESTGHSGRDKLQSGNRLDSLGLTPLPTMMIGKTEATKSNAHLPDRLAAVLLPFSCIS